ncbi:MAG: hypothetical protein ACRDOG_13975 [Gaiellaceae bacterium]
MNGLVYDLARRESIGVSPKSDIVRTPPDDPPQEGPLMLVETSAGTGG